MCPPPPDCPRCPALPAEKCRGEGGLGMFDVLGRIDIRPLGNETYAGFANRSQGMIDHMNTFINILAQNLNLCLPVYKISIFAHFFQIAFYLPLASLFFIDSQMLRMEIG